MLVDLFAIISLILTSCLILIVYAYSLKIYGLKATIITSLLLTSFVLIGILSGGYSSVGLYIYPPMTAKLGGYEFHLTDPISIFPSFFIIFELSRFALKKMHGSILTNLDILKTSLITSLFGFCLQLITDTTAGAVGYYYSLHPPTVNIFGFSIEFLLSFTIYGLWGGIFLLLEKKYRKNIKKL